MITREELTSFCNTFLCVTDVLDPYCQNDLQIPGKKEITKIALGTTASKNFLTQAAKWRADAVLVHHGLFWGKGVLALDQILTNRIRILLENEISLLAYHLPLDAHPIVGNNVQIAKKLHLKNIHMKNICAVGDFSSDQKFVEITKRCEDIFGQTPIYAENFSKKPVKKIGICSGGGADYAKKLLKDGIDTFLTGEISEQHFHDFSELGINLLVCGHHATERLGAQAFGEVLKKEFLGIDVSFFSEPCPV